MALTRRNLMLTGLAAAAVPTLPRAQAQLSVVATTGMIADAASVILGDMGRVQGLMGAGIDPHSFRQTRSDIVAMSRADLVLWHGLYLEAQMEDFLLNLGRSRQVVAVAETLDPVRLLRHADYAGRFDPHVWMDPAIWTDVVAAITEALQDARPDMSDTLQSRSDAYRATLARLDGYARSVLTTVPAPSRVLVTAHDAFGYFGRAYGFEVLGIQGISTESEAGLNRIRQLVDTLVDRRIAAVFVESSVSDRNMRALIEGAAARGHQVRIGGELFSDAMGAPGSYEGTYPGMIDHNITTIARALGGAAPARGMDGLLKGTS